MLTIEVKVSGISNLAEARYCAGMGVQFVGYNLDTASEKALSITAIKEIQGWITGTEPVLELGTSGIFTSNDWDHADDLILDVPFSRISEFSTRKKLFIRLKEWNTETIAAISTNHVLISPEINETNAGVILDSILKHTSHTVFISWRGSAEKLKEILQTYPIAGIELKGAESQAGIFEAHDLADVIELLEADE